MAVPVLATASVRRGAADAASPFPPRQTKDAQLAGPAHVVHEAPR